MITRNSRIGVRSHVWPFFVARHCSPLLPKPHYFGNGNNVARLSGRHVLGVMSCLCGVVNALDGHNSRPLSLASWYSTTSKLGGMLPEMQSSADGVKKEKMMKMMKKPDTVGAYNSIIRSCVKKQEWSKAEELFAEMRSEAEKRTGTGTGRTEPDLRTYNSVLVARKAVGNVQGMEALYDEMQAKGIAPNAVTYNTLIAGLGRARRWARMEALFAEMQVRAVQPDVVTYSVMIDGLGKAGRVALLDALFAAMKARGIRPNVVAYNSMIAGHARMAARTQRMEELFAEMRREGVEPDLITYNTLIAGLAKAGQAQRARALFAEMQKNGIEPDALTHKFIAMGSTQH